MISQPPSQPDAQFNPIESQARQLMSGRLHPSVNKTMLMRSKQQTNLSNPAPKN